MKKTQLFAIGLAIFTMLFGAGNVVFPLGLGRDVGSEVLYALLGLCLTGVLVPLLGLVAVMFFDGDYKKFLGTMGTIPSAIIAFVCMVLIGPFGATPRCITLAYAAIKWHVPDLSLFVFSVFAAAIVFAATLRKGLIVELFGRFLGPLKLVLLLSIIVLGVFMPSSSSPVLLAPWKSFYRGLREGYWTMDLLGTIFFSGLIVSAIKRYASDEEKSSTKKIAWLGLQAGIIGALLLGLVYAGFCLVASMYRDQLLLVDKDQLLSALAILILGARAGILANVTVAMACLTTAIAISAVFADYLRSELFCNRLSYKYALLLTVGTTFVTSNFGFSGIARIVEPVMLVCYPSLVALALANIAREMVGFQYVRLVVYATLTMTVISKFI